MVGRTNRVNGWTFDAAGNVTNDGSHTCQYDAENRLIKIDGGSTAQYAYGPQGERVSKLAGGVTTYFYWGIGEKVSGSWTRLYVLGLGGKLVEYSDGGTKFFVTNHLGTIAARMDLSGQTMELYRYLPYGERYAGNQTPHQYTGKERDAESGLDYFGARYLASAHGRWMSVDPVLGETRNPQRLNRYSYVGNDPVGTVDPEGTEWQPGPCHNEWYYPPALTELPAMSTTVCEWYWNSRNAFTRQAQESRGGGGTPQINHDPLLDKNDPILSDSENVQNFFCPYQKASLGKRDDREAGAVIMRGANGGWEILYGFHVGKDPTTGQANVSFPRLSEDQWDNVVGFAHTHPDGDVSMSDADYDAMTGFSVPQYAIMSDGIYRLGTDAKSPEDAVKVMDQLWRKGRECDTGTIEWGQW